MGNWLEGGLDRHRISERSCFRDYLREDSSIDGSDISGNGLVAAVRAGRENDLVSLYGFIYDQNGYMVKVNISRFYIRDGKNIGVSVNHNEVFVNYGRQRDLRTRFCFSQRDGWKRSPGNNRGGSTFPFCRDPWPGAVLP